MARVLGSGATVDARYVSMAAAFRRPARAACRCGLRRAGAGHTPDRAGGVRAESRNRHVARMTLAIPGAIDTQRAWGRGARGAGRGARSREGAAGVGAWIRPHPARSRML